MLNLQEVLLHHRCRSDWQLPYKKMHACIRNRFANSIAKWLNCTKIYEFYFLSIWVYWFRRMETDIHLFLWFYCWLQSAKWSFGSFQGEFWFVKFIKRRDFFNLCFEFSLLGPYKNWDKIWSQLLGCVQFF